MKETQHTSSQMKKILALVVKQVITKVDLTNGAQIEMITLKRVKQKIEDWILCLYSVMAIFLFALGYYIFMYTGCFLGWLCVVYQKITKGCKDEVE